jgi:hypothetical protein
VFFAGNGVDSYLVQSAYITQDTHSVAMKVNGATTFYVPAFGRWSDYSSIAGFTVPGTADLVTVVKLNVPMLIPIVGGGDTTQTGPSAPGVGIEIRSFLVLNFEGADGATTWVEEAQGLSPDSNENRYIKAYNPSLPWTAPYSGSSSLFLMDGSPILTYNVPNVGNYYVWVSYVKVHYAQSGAGGISGEVHTPLGLVSWGLRSLSHNSVISNCFICSIVDDDYLVIDTIPSVWTADAWHKVKVIANGNSVSVYLDDIVRFSATSPDVANAFGNLDSINYSVYNAQALLDKVTIGETEDNSVSVTSTETITVTDNSLIQAGDTITITGVSA